jgi:hypothetical protein
MGGMSVGAGVALGAVAGVGARHPRQRDHRYSLAPEAGLVLGALIGWLWRRDAA